MKKKIGIIGQFPPPIHGLSKALDTLYNSYLNKEFEFTKIDITSNNKILINLVKILFSKLDLYYLTISQSKLGNIRDLIIIKLIQLKKRKIIIHLHGGGFRNILDNEFGSFQKNLNYKILSEVSAGIVLGDSLKYIFKGIIPEEKIYIVKNCVDDEFLIDDNEFELKLNLLKSKKQLQILYLSNFIKEKGYLEVLNIAKVFKENNKNNFKFVFAGKFFDKNDEKEFFDFIKLNNLNEIIEYKGVVNGESKRKLLKESDIFILLTKYKNEGQPISILEAMGNGILIICTDHAGIPDIVKNSINGIVIKTKDLNIEDIVQEMIQINNNYIQIIARNNRVDIMDNYKEYNYLKNIYEIMSNI